MKAGNVKGQRVEKVSEADACLERFSSFDLCDCMKGTAELNPDGSFVSMEETLEKLTGANIQKAS